MTQITTIIGTFEGDLLAAAEDCRHLIVGRGGNDLIGGSEDDDTLLGGAGDDWVVGGGGNDLIKGWRGNDTLVGGVGDDTILGSFDADYLSGGAGNDVFLYKTRGDFGDVILDFDPNEDTIVLDDDRFGTGAIKRVEYNDTTGVLTFSKGTGDVILAVIQNKPTGFNVETDVIVG